MKNHQDLWLTYFPQFIENSDKGLELLMDSSSLVTFPAGRQLFYPGTHHELAYELGTAHSLFSSLPMNFSMVILMKKPRKMKKSSGSANGMS